MILTPRQVIERAHTGLRISQELMPILNGLHVAHPELLANLSAAYIYRKPSISSAYPLDPRTLAKLAVEFHRKAGTDKPWVIKNIRILATDAPRLRLAHQPNLFPSLGVVSQFFLLEASAQKLAAQLNRTPGQMFVVVDYDAAQDQRFRVSHIPDAQRLDGSLSVSGVVPSTLFQNPMWTVPKPPVEIVNKWIKQIDILMCQDLSILAHAGIFERKRGFIQENVNTIEELLWDAYKRASTLVEFNAFALSKIVNIYWEMPIAFVFGRELQTEMKTAYEFLLENWPRLKVLSAEAVEFFLQHGVQFKYIPKQSPEPLPFWITCDAKSGDEICNSRVPLYAESEQRLIAHGRCKRCGSDYSFDLGTYSKVNLEPACHYGMSPRILFDNLLDAVALGIMGGAMYIGAAEHMLLTNYVAMKMNWPMPPHCLWKPRGIYYGLAECRAIEILRNNELPDRLIDRAISAVRWTYLGKASVLYYLMNQGMNGMPAMWRKFFSRNANVQDVNDGKEESPLVVSDYLVEELRALTQKLESEAVEPEGALHERKN